MKKMQKVLSLLLALVLVLGLTTACGKKKEEATPSPAGDVTDAPEGDATDAPKNDVTLKVVTQMGGTDPNTENYKALIADFETEYPYITIEDDSAVADETWKTKVATDFATDNEPDVIQFFVDANANDLLATDKFVTIDEIKAEYPDYAANILPDCLAVAANPDGVQRAVPTTGYWEGLFCNKDLFEQYNVELPKDWAGLKKAIETFNANGITPIAVSLNEIPHYWIEHLMLMMAGPDEFQTLPATAPESWAKGLSLFKELRDLNAFPKATDTITNDEAGNLFKEKKAAMQLDGSWFANGITDTENTTVVPFPTVEGGKATYGDIISGMSSGFYITKKAWNDPDKRDAAVKFVTANTSDEMIAKYWNGNGKAAANVEVPAGMTNLQNAGAELAANANSVALPTDARVGSEAYNVIVGGAVGISTGESKAEDVLNEALEIANR